MTRIFRVDPVPDWLPALEQRMAWGDLAPEQLWAASRLLRGAALPGLPEPSMTSVSYHKLSLASFQWINGRRAVTAVPLWFEERLHAELSFHRDGGDPVWSGWPAEPVPMLRAMLAWVYGGREGPR